MPFLFVIVFFPNLIFDVCSIFCHLNLLGLSRQSCNAIFIRHCVLSTFLLYLLHCCLLSQDYHISIRRSHNNIFIRHCVLSKLNFRCMYHFMSLKLKPIFLKAKLQCHFHSSWKLRVHLKKISSSRIFLLQTTLSGIKNLLFYTR